MRTMFRAMLVALMVLTFTSASDASQILKKTIQEKARQSDIVLVGKVTGVRNTETRETKHQFEQWEAECSVDEVVCGDKTTKVVTVTFFVKPKEPLTSLPIEDSLESGKMYILFLREDGQRLSLIAPWDSRMVVSDKYDVWDEDRKGDKEMLKRSQSSLNNVPLVTLTHDNVLKKIAISWQGKK